MKSYKSYTRFVLINVSLFVGYALIQLPDMLFAVIDAIEEYWEGKQLEEQRKQQSKLRSRKNKEFH